MIYCVNANANGRENIKSIGDKATGTDNAFRSGMLSGFLPFTMQKYMHRMLSNKKTMRKPALTGSVFNCLVKFHLSPLLFMVANILLLIVRQVANTIIASMNNESGWSSKPTYITPGVRYSVHTPIAPCINARNKNSFQLAFVRGQMVFRVVLKASDTQER